MICHGLISRDAVQSLLGDEGMDDGLYLVRKSRQRTNSYTLHVCLQRRIRNFEITVKKDGKLYILPNAEFESLLKLVYHYHKEKVQYTLCVCVCTCACACVQYCVCVCVHVCYVTYFIHHTAWFASSST